MSQSQLTVSHELTHSERLEFLKVEMGLLQGTLDKYDQLIFQSRNWFITMWLGSVGLAITSRQFHLVWLAVAASGLYWLLEGLFRHQYWYKYVCRYRTMRRWLYERQPDEGAAIALYDLTNHYSSESSPRYFGDPIGRWRQLWSSFFKIEPTVVYAAMGLAAFTMRSLLPSVGPS